MAQATDTRIDTAAELLTQLLHNFCDDEFRRRVEDDELKQTPSLGEVLLQYDPTALDEVATLAFQLHRWIAGRARMAKKRQDVKTAAALNLSTAELSQLRSDLHHRGAVQIPAHGRGDDLDLAAGGHR